MRQPSSSRTGFTGSSPLSRLLFRKLFDVYMKDLCGAYEKFPEYVAIPILVCFNRRHPDQLFKDTNRFRGYAKYAISS